MAIEIKKRGRPKNAKNKKITIDKRAAAKITKEKIKKTMEAIQNAKAAVEVIPEPKVVFAEKNKKGFCKDNPGKQPGCRHHRTIFLEAITEEVANKILEMFIDVTLEGRDSIEGDVDCILFAMDRLFPKEHRRRTLKFDFSHHNLHTISGINNAANNVIGEMGNEIITIDEAQDAITILKDKREFNLHELQEEVDKFRNNREKM